MRKRRIFGTAFLFLAFAAVLLGLDLFLLLRPDQVRARVLAALAATFARPVAFDRIEYSLFRGIALHGFAVQGPDGAPDLAVGEVAVGVDWRRLRLKEIKVVRPRVRIRRGADGEVSIVRLFRPELFRADEGPPGELPGLAISIEDAEVHFRDESYERGDVHEATIAGIDADLVLDPARGLEIRGAITDPGLWKSLRFAGDIDPRDGTFAFALECRKGICGERLVAMLPPAPKRLFRKFRFEGIGDADVRATNRGVPRPEVTAEVKIHQGGMRFENFPYPVRDVTGTIRFEKNQVLLRDLYGRKAGGEYGCEGEVTIFPKGVDDRIDIRIFARNLPVDEDLAQALPPAIAPVYRRFAPSGRADAQVHVFGWAKPIDQEDDIHWLISGEWRKGAVRFADFPVPIDDVRARIEVRDERFKIENLRGAALGGTVEADGYASPEKIAVTVHGAGLAVGPGVHAWLPASARRSFDAIAPEGVVDAWILVRGEPDEAGELAPGFLARVVPRPGLEARYEELPLPLTVSAGEVFISEDGARIEGVRAARGDLAVAVSGALGTEEAGLPIALEVAIERLRLDADLRAALRGRLRAWAEQLGVEGGELERARLVVDKPAGAPEPAISGEAEWRNVRLVPPAFRYPIERLAGAVRFSPQAIDIAALVGRAGAAEIFGSGRIGLREGVTSTAEIVARGLPIDRRLRDAIVGDAERRAFDAVAPAGRLDLALRFETGREVAPVLSAAWREGQALLSFFPYPLAGLTADFTARPGRVVLDRLAATLGEAKVSATGLLAGGMGRISLQAHGLALDRRLRDALPPGMRRVFAEADPAGTARVRANIAYDPGLAPRPLIFNGEVALACERLDVGLALREVEGTVALEGRAATMGDALSLSGTASFRRALWKGQAIAAARARFGLDGGLFEVSDLRAVLLGGLLRGEVYAFTEPPQTVGGWIALSGGELARAVPTKPPATGGAAGGERRAGWGHVSGRIDSRVVFASRPGEAVHGEGTLTIREGKLGELPLMAGMLNFLSFEAPSRPVWDDVRVAFRLAGGETVIDRASFSSSALSFVGKGTMRGEKLRLRVVHELGRPWFSEIPIFGPIWRFIVGHLIEFEITGTLEEPQIRPIPVKVVTDPVRWLFGDRPDEEAPRSGGTE